MPRICLTTSSSRHHDALYTSEADSYPSFWVALHQQLSPQRVVVERHRSYEPVLVPEEPAPSDIDAQLEDAFDEPPGPVGPAEPEEDDDDDDEDNGRMVFPFIGEILVRVPQGDWKMVLALSMILFGGGFFLWVLRSARREKNQA